MSNMKDSWNHTTQLEDIPELIHRIQSFLPAKDAARTCILSKAWLQAWSTIPTLRFPAQFQKSVTDEQKRKYEKVIDDTLQRYHRDNLSIESLDLQLQIQNQESAFVAEKWIQPIVSKSCLKELSLKIWGFLNDSYTLPNELFSSENLSTINKTGGIGNYRIQICSNPFIKCVTLRVLDLQHVHISEQVLHKLLSTCTLLEKIELQCCIGLKNVIVKNLPHLRELVISSVVLKISNLPRLRLFNYYARNWGSNKPVPFIPDSLGSLKLLSIHGVIVDGAFLDIIKSKFPLLERLKLDIEYWGLESLVITSASLKFLALSFWKDDRQFNVRVYAPKLLSFIYNGKLLGLHFLTIAPKYIYLAYFLERPLDHLFFLTLREVLNSSSEFRININEPSQVLPLNIDIDDLRRRCSFPLTNMHNLRLTKSSNVNIRFFDAFFLIFHPCYIISTKVVVREMMERQPTDLKDVELKNPFTRKWETLTSSSTSVLDALTDSDSVECKLNWVSR